MQVEHAKMKKNQWRKYIKEGTAMFAKETEESATMLHIFKK